MSTITGTATTSGGLGTTTALPVGRWHVDPVHSNVGFAVRHSVVLTFRGRFERFAGALVVAEDGTAELTGTVQADSVVVRNDTLAAHLASPDFFDTDRHPEITFSSQDLRRIGDDVVVDGRMTLKGTTRPVRLTGTVVDEHEDPDGDVRIGLALATTVDRTAFGLRWNEPLPKGGMLLADDVRIEVDLALIREA